MQNQFFIKNLTTRRFGRSFVKIKKSTIYYKNDKTKYRRKYTRANVIQAVA